MAIEFKRFADEATAGDALHEELIRVFTAPAEFGPRVIMLAGGSTPLKIYERIAENPPDTVAPGTWLLLSDDRHVPVEDERSNYRAIRPMALSLGIPPARILHPDPDLSPTEAAADFGLHIAAPGRSGADFELGILGIGEDGHTASLFSPELVPLAGDAGGAGRAPAGDGGRAPAGGAGHTQAGGQGNTSAGDAGNTATGGVVAVATGSPTYTSTDELACAAGEQAGVERISVSAAVLLCFRRLIFFAPGASKQKILARIVDNPRKYPAGRVLMQHPDARVWTTTTED